MSGKYFDYRDRAPFINTERDQFIKDQKAKTEEREQRKAAKRKRKGRSNVTQPPYDFDALVAECKQREISLVAAESWHWKFHDAVNGRALLDYYPTKGTGCLTGKFQFVGDWRAAIELAAERIEKAPNAAALQWASGEADKLGMTLTVSMIESKRGGTQHWVFKCSATSRMLLNYYPKTLKGFRVGGKLYDIGDEMAAVEEARLILNGGTRHQQSTDPRETFKAMFS
jgi:hypothetical protein